MMEKFEELRRQLSELAIVLNEFKSEAVQLRILDVVLSGEVGPNHFEKQDETTTRRQRRKKATGVTDSESTTARIPSSGTMDDGIKRSPTSEFELLRTCPI